MSHVRDSDTEGGVNPYEPLIDAAEAVPAPEARRATVAEISARPLPVAVVSALSSALLCVCFFLGVEDSVPPPVRILLLFGPAMGFAAITVVKASKRFGRRSCVLISVVSSLMVGAVPIAVNVPVAQIYSEIPGIHMASEWWLFAVAFGGALLVTGLLALAKSQPAAGADEA